MKKCSIVLVLLFSLLSCQESNFQIYKNGLQKHILDNDEEKSINTTIVKMEPISAKKLDEAERKNANEVYECKIYLRANWSYEGGMSVYNISDTLNCYYDNDKKFLRAENLRKEE